MKTMCTIRSLRPLSRILFTALICLAAGCSKEKETVEDPFLELDPGAKDIIMTAIATEKHTFIVNTNQPSWEATSDKDWCKILPTRYGEGFTIVAEANGGTEREPAIVTVRAGSATPITIGVTQDEYIYFNTDPTTRNIVFISKPKAAHAKDYIVATNMGEWEVSSNQEWCNVTVWEDGRGFTIMADENLDWVSPETATVSVTCGEQDPINITVKQKPRVQKFAIGDYYYYSYTGRYPYHDPLMTIKWDEENNRWIEWDTVNFEWIPSEKEPQGVVVWLDETAEEYDPETKTGLVGYALGLREKDNLIISRIGLNGYNQTNGMTSGSFNSSMVSWQDPANNYPAFYWVRTDYPMSGPYKDVQAWFIPAYEQWQTLYEDYNANKTIIEAALDFVGGMPLCGKYWTATGTDKAKPYETFWSYNFDSQEYANIKRDSQGIKTRPICTFNVEVYTTN